VNLTMKFKRLQFHAITGMAALHFVFSLTVFAQSISSGTIEGVIKDQSGAVLPRANVTVRNAITNYSQTVVSDPNGSFRLNNVPENAYQLTVSAPGFTSSSQQIAVRSTIPIKTEIILTVEQLTASVTVEENPALLETDPSAHTNADTLTLEKLPDTGIASGLSDLINYSTGGTAADANGFFHPLGDHAQVSFVIDGQPISDQQSKVFSTQLPANAIESMEIITGAPDAQYGDKSSLVVNATTKSGLGQRPTGGIETFAGSFGTYGENAAFGFGGPKLGNFSAINGVRSGHFLDTPELFPIHDIGNNENIFDRFDYEPSAHDVLHFNLFLARNWFQVPNSFDQLTQDQKQRVLTWSIAPGYQHTFGSQTLLTINPYIRHDQVNYYASRDPFQDTPVTVSQNRFLMNWGVKADLSTNRGAHMLKYGTQVQQTRLQENFGLGVTDFTFNPVCVNQNGDALLLPGISGPGQCAGINPSYQANDSFLPGLLPFDLTRGGSELHFHQLGNINQFAVYVTDQFTKGGFTVNAGVRDDEYRGLVVKNGVQPRIGLAYTIKPSGTVLRAAYSRTFETPFNENLLLSSSTGVGGLAQTVFGAKGILPLQPGNRNQFNAGFQQRLGRFIVTDWDYFWKYTDSAYDFDVIFNTPITFPVAWTKSKIDGFTGRVSTTNLYGFQAYFTVGHNRARYFPPEIGGLISQGLGSTTGVFRIDHDQAFQTTTNLRYQKTRNWPWIDLIWRFDSGLVVSGVPDVAAAAQLTPNQQVDIGFSCNGVRATVQQPISDCNGIGRSTLLTLPQTGTENDDHNPDRVKPRNLFDIAFGVDNLLRSEEKQRMTLRFTVTNLTNKVALYNFLSTFSGTHFLPPRTYQASIGYTF
jgi:Carboxypeptidase regulatory-like domain/TonB-dependent Receptor Plug Domain